MFTYGHGISIVLPCDSVPEVLQRAFSKGNIEQCVLISLFCWSLWNRRNKWVWDHVSISTFGVKVNSLNLLADRRREVEGEGE